ncbi:hypothetical protein GCM10009817_24430 [Terrabacter lapilli]|uniref:Uncharacterized protein n=1 Tax=Terrabacter lapilli TaxID=436231 RepID=A0ABN2S971_9MICO
MGLKGPSARHSAATDRSAVDASVSINPQLEGSLSHSSASSTPYERRQADPLTPGPALLPLCCRACRLIRVACRLLRVHRNTGTWAHRRNRNTKREFD